VWTLVASGAVAATLSFALPAEAPVAMADPVINSADFYRTHLMDRAARSTYRGPESGVSSPPAPIAGLSQAQTDNAYIIVEVGKQLQLPRQAYLVAIVTALQESDLHNLANPLVPSSFNYPHEGSSTNFDSVGLFQQRPSIGWGTVAQLMDPVQSAARFYAKLVTVGGWPGMAPAKAAQAVQRSAFPNAYAKHAEFAQKIVNALV
jgi:hypothetical protein